MPHPPPQQHGAARSAARAASLELDSRRFRADAGQENFFDRDRFRSRGPLASASDKSSGNPAPARQIISDFTAFDQSKLLNVPEPDAINASSLPGSEANHVHLLGLSTQLAG